MIIHSFDDINIEKNFKLASEGTFVLMMGEIASGVNYDYLQNNTISSQLFISRTDFQLFIMHNHFIRLEQYFSCLSHTKFRVLSIKWAHELNVFAELKIAFDE